MSVELIVHQNPDYLAVLWGGKFSQENLDRYFAALNTLTEEARSLPRLHDARHINMDVSAELIRSVCKSRIELFRQGMPLIKGAVLVEDKLDYGMLRMFSVYYDNPELDLRIFSKIEDAWIWLAPAIPSSAWNRKNPAALDPSACFQLVGLVSLMMSPACS